MHQNSPFWTQKSKNFRPNRYATAITLPSL